jgi:hypothetical protein
MGKLLTTKEFIERASKVHKNKYDYSLAEYITGQEKITLICPVHGLFEQRAHSHLSGGGCSKCHKNRLRTKEEFTILAGAIHNYKYRYEPTNYIKDCMKVEVLCNNHGIFKITPSSHLQGHGCPVCANVSRSITHSEVSTGWSLTKWVKGSEASFNFDSFKVYFVKIESDKELFYKIGRTYCALNKRMRCVPYSYEVVHIVSHSDPKTIFDLEAHLKRTFKAHKYTPLKKFNGMGECFKFDDPTIQSVLREMTLPSTNDIIPTSTK